MLEQRQKGAVARSADASGPSTLRKAFHAAPTPDRSASWATPRPQFEQHADEPDQHDRHDHAGELQVVPLVPDEIADAACAPTISAATITNQAMPIEIRIPVMIIGTPPER